MCRVDGDAGFCDFKDGESGLAEGDVLSLPSQLVSKKDELCVNAVGRDVVLNKVNQVGSSSSLSDSVFPSSGRCKDRCKANTSRSIVPLWKRHIIAAKQLQEKDMVEFWKSITELSKPRGVQGSRK